MFISFRRRRIRTTYSDHSYVRYRNLNEDLEVTAINQLYVSDITYIPIGNRYAYLNLVTDAYSRKIIGYHLHKSLHAQGTIKALEMALQQRSDTLLSYSTIHHRTGDPVRPGYSALHAGYCCHDYIKLLKGMTCSYP